MTESIIVTGTIACGAVVEILAKKRGELEKRFPSFFSPVDRTEALYPNLSAGELLDLADRTARSAEPYGVTAILPLSEGGIFKGLWELGEMRSTGLCADLKRIPLLQETVEILEYYDRNPYEENSKGSLLLSAEDGIGLCRALRNAGIDCTIIGTLTTGKAKTLLYDGHTRYIDKPRGGKSEEKDGSA